MSGPFTSYLKRKSFQIIRTDNVPGLPLHSQRSGGLGGDQGRQRVRSSVADPDPHGSAFKKSTGSAWTDADPDPGG